MTVAMFSGERSVHQPQPTVFNSSHDRRAHRQCFGDYHAEILEVARHEQARELCQLLKFLASRYETAEFHIFQPESSHFAAQELLVCVISLAHNHEFAILRRWQLRYPIKKVLNLLYGVQPTKETKFSWQVVPQKGRFRCRHFVSIIGQVGRVRNDGDGVSVTEVAHMFHLGFACDVHTVGAANVVAEAKLYQRPFFPI